MTCDVDRRSELARTEGRNHCLTCGDVAIPMRVIRTGEDGLADCVTEDGQASQVELALVDAAPGDEVLVHACVAIQRLGGSPAEARA